MWHLWCPIRKFSWRSLSGYKFGCMNNWFSRLGNKAKIHLCLDLQAFKDYSPPPPPSLFLLIWNGNKKKSRTNQPSHHPPPLPPKRKAKKILSDKPFHLTWYRIVHFRPLWEKWWNANLKEQSCGRMLCLNDLFVLTYEHRVQNVKVANTPFPSPPLRFELNYLTSWETDHPDSHITEDLGGGESARSFSCCHCSA